MSDDAFEQEKNVRLRRELGAQKSLTDRAAGFITCVGCRFWPDVTYWKLKKTSERYWAASCDNCNSSPVIGATRDECQARWNEKHKRWNDSGAANVTPQT